MTYSQKLRDLSKKNEYILYLILCTKKMNRRYDGQI